jgi:hypothetical protein
MYVYIESERASTIEATLVEQCVCLYAYIYIERERERGRESSARALLHLRYACPELKHVAALTKPLEKMQKKNATGGRALLHLCCAGLAF